MKKEYTNGEVTITWDPSKCIHAGNCVRGLPQVFQPKERPWIRIDAAHTKQLIDQIKNCPSGALGYYMNTAEPAGEGDGDQPTIIEIVDDGPILIHGSIDLKFNARTMQLKKKITALCRCGQSSNKPYCDGSHRKS